LWNTNVLSQAENREKPLLSEELSSQKANRMAGTRAIITLQDWPEASHCRCPPSPVCPHANWRWHKPKPPAKVVSQGHTRWPMIIKGTDRGQKNMAMARWWCVLSFIRKDIQITRWNHLIFHFLQHLLLNAPTCTSLSSYLNWIIVGAVYQWCPQGHLEAIRCHYTQQRCQSH
jgi:hypothetical protein